MSRIFLTGDTHGNFIRFSSSNFPVGRTLTKDDYVIILGDFGAIWDDSKQEQHNLKWLAEKPWTTLFICGNHENFNLLDSFPIVDILGGKAHKINDSIYHLMRGEIFSICGRSFLAMGGNHSHDIQDGVLEPGDPRIKDWIRDPFKLFRVNGVSWWPQEVPSTEERTHILSNLAAHDNKVDYVLAHALPASVCRIFGCEPNEWELWIQQHITSIDFRTYFSGHYHLDEIPYDNYHYMYHDIIELPLLTL